MSNENNNSKKEKENQLAKGWNDFASTLKNGFQNFQKGLEEQSKKNVENWEKSKDKVKNFFKKTDDKWNAQVEEWKSDMSEIQQNNKEQWDARKERIRNDFENWQEKTRQDWKDGVKAWNRGIYRAIGIFLLILIIVLGGLFALAYIFTMVMSNMPS